MILYIYIYVYDIYIYMYMIYIYISQIPTFSQRSLHIPKYLAGWPSLCRWRRWRCHERFLARWKDP